MSVSYNTGVAQATATASDTYALTIPSGVLPGDLLIYAVYAGFDNTSGGSSMTVSSTGTTLTQIGSTLSYAGYYTWKYQLYYVIAGSGDPAATITASWTGASTWGAMLNAYTGATGIDVSNSSTISAGSSWATPSLTTVADGDWALQITAGDRSGNDTITPPSGTTARTTGTNASGPYISLVDNNADLSSGSAIGGQTWTSSASETDIFVSTIGITGGPSSGGTIPWQFNVGAPSGSDDTAHINSVVSNAVAWAQANNNYAEVIFEPATYILSGGTTMGGSTQGNAQIPLPYLDDNSVPKVTLVMKGSADASAFPYYEQTVAQIPSGTILNCTLTDQTPDDTWGAPSVVGGPSPGVIGENFSNLLLVIDGIMIMTPPNPSIMGFDLRTIAQANVPNAAFLVDDTSLSETFNDHFPTNTNSVGLYMPLTLNNDNCNIGNFACVGAYYGLAGGEHLTAQRVGLIYNHVCMYVAGTSAAQHGWSILYASCEGSEVIIQSGTGGKFPIEIAQIDTELTYTWTVDDSGNSLYGTIHWAGASGDNVPILNGGGNLEVLSTLQSRGAVTAPSIPASGTALTNPFWRHAAVNITGGTVSEIDIDGAATGFTSTGCTVIVPSGKTITLTYSSTPSWQWTLL
jgi:hypothetical protein